MSTQPGQQTDFGANEWLVYEIHQQYLKDPESVSEAWREFLSDYDPGKADGANGNGSAPAPAAEKPAEKPVAEKPAPDKPAPAPQAAPSAPAPEAAPAPKAAEAPKPKAVAPAGEGAKTAPLKGAAARVVTNMEASLSVPTATSVRSVPAKLLADNRIVINSHLKRSRGGKVSFTHLIGYALVRAVADVPVMNNSFGTDDNGKPLVVTPGDVGLGLAIDLQNANGSRSLVVAAIKGADTMDFAQYWAAYEDIVRRARAGKLTTEDFQGTTISLTNPGGIGTVHSVPRLMQGAGAIIGVGAMEYPAEFQGASEDTLARLAVSKVITLTSTYDHRIIQGAQSGEFLRRMHQLLLGEDGFYDEVFASLRIPYVPVRWVPDQQASHEGDLDKATRVNEMIHAYRVRGHLMADTDPLEFKVRSHPDLDVVTHGLSLWDLDREFPVAGFAGKRVMKLRDVLGVLRDSYCRTVGIEYMHIQDPAERRWLQERVEKKAQAPDRKEQLHVLERLNAGEAFESFLQTKYVGQKRFSLEGGESLIPMLDGVLQRAADEGLDEVAFAMPHRGRLNVLANIVGKSYAQIFREFEGNIDPRTAHGSGDVKYHLGAEGSFTSLAGNDVAVSLQANPSHLETVDPVLEGVVRAKQDMINKGEQGFTVLPVLLHGDAAFAGQGIVMETLQMAQLRGYRTGGTIHVVVNNQVGFTTGPHSARSSVYATDVAKTVQAPIFHVNGDDPEACVRVAKLAFDYRQAFHKDVVIDMVCYRRRGHSEVDEPSFTQPLMYDTIDAKRSVRKIYTENLIGRGDITVEEAEEALRNYQAAAGEGLPGHPRGGQGRADAARAGAGRRRRPAHRDLPRRRAAGRGQPGLLPGGLHGPPPPAAAAAEAREDDRGRARSTGRWARRSRSGRCCSRATRCAWPARTPVAAPSATGTPSSSTAPPAASTPRWRTSRPTRRRSTSTTRCCRSTPRWASSTATPSRGPTPSCSGRRSSATSSTSRWRWSTSSSPPARPSGASAPASCCCCRTASRARARTTRPRGSSASCSCAPRTTWWWPRRRPRRTTSTCFAGSRSSRASTRSSSCPRSRCSACARRPRRWRTSPTAASSRCWPTRTRLLRTPSSGSC